MPKKLKHKDTEDTGAQITQAQSTDGQGTGPRARKTKSRGEPARPYLKNASYPARCEDLAASAQQQGADQDVVDLIPDDEDERAVLRRPRRSPRTPFPQPSADPTRPYPPSR